MKSSKGKSPSQQISPTNQHHHPFYISTSLSFSDCKSLPNLLPVFILVQLLIKLSSISAMADGQISLDLAALALVLSRDLCNETRDRIANDGPKNTQPARPARAPVTHTLGNNHCQL